MSSEVSVWSLSRIALGLWQHGMSWWEYMAEEPVRLVVPGKQRETGILESQ
jgi:hypothetical protein